MKPGINIFSSPEEAVKAFSTMIKDLVEKAVDVKTNFSVALSGGKIAPILFDYLAKNHNENLNWEKVSLFWGDERCVPPEDSESNYGMTKKHLLDYIKIPSKNINRILGENDPHGEAKRYSDIIRNSLDSVNNLPEFEIMLLGLGEDGHTVSIFPNQMELLESDKICEVAFHPETKRRRITLSGNVINNSKKIYFLVSGKSKSFAVGEILNKKSDYLNLPAAHIKPVNGELIWFLDKEAASGINYKT